MAATTSSSSLITVSCVNHQQILFNGLCNLFLNKQKVDCEMEYTGRSIRVHRILMDVFMSPDSLQLHTAPDLTPTANADDPDSNSLDLLVEFLYRGRVNVYQEQLAGLLKVAKVCKFHMLVGAVQAAIKREETKCQLTPDIQKDVQLTSKPQRATQDEESDPETGAEDSESDKDEPDSESPEIEQPPRNNKTYSRKRPRRFKAAWSGATRRAGSNETGIRPGPATTATSSIDLPPSTTTSSINMTPTSPILFTGVHPSWNRELGAYQCSGCPKTFSRIGLLNYHAKIHGERSFLCQYCNKGFKRKYDVVVHLRSHRNEGLFGDEIPAGEGSGPTTRRLGQHADRPKMSFPCSACGVTCSSRHELKEHVLSDHTCRPCGKNFISKAALDFHSRSHDAILS